MILVGYHFSKLKCLRNLSHPYRQNYQLPQKGVVSIGFPLNASGGKSLMSELNALQVNIDFIFLLIFCSLLLFLPLTTGQHTRGPVWSCSFFVLNQKTMSFPASFFCPQFLLLLPSVGQAVFVLSATFLTIQPK